MSSVDLGIVYRLEADVASTPQISPPGQWTIFWRRFKRDRFALGSLVFLIFLFLLVFVGYSVLTRILGHNATDQFPFANGFASEPAGPWTHVRDAISSADTTKRTTLFVMGSDGTLGRDEFLRILRGGQASLEVGVGSALLAVLIGLPLGALAGLLGGWTDAAVSRLTEFFMGFPILLLLVALGWSVRERVDSVTVHGVFAPGVVALTLLIGAFSWFYPARIVRASVLSLRRQDFVEAARMVGASTPWIIRKHMLPHLVGPVAVYFSIIAATNIVLESALSFLNIGIPLPDPSWGNMLATNWGHFFIVENPSGTLGFVTSIWTTAFPAAAIALTVLALSLFGEGVRRAFDPGSSVR
jgi:ABC-type dipeptide/oligopeptide/nickel transport system permease subunit